MNRQLTTALLACALAYGCSVDPYCVTCAEDTDSGTDGSMDATSGDGGDDGGDDAGGDAGMSDAAVMDSMVIDVGPDGCLGSELCNDIDDDCDTFVDEGFELSRDPSNCGTCGNVCAPPHAFASCTEGVCGFTDCDVGFIDLNGELSDGCEYRCLPTADDDVICDLRDNDCDGEIDEDVAFDTDADNCGSCGRTCRFAHSTASCVAGVCELADCADDFFDLDGSRDNGCEYSCTLADPPVEVCNVRDDNCNGVIDEGDPGGGEACGMSEGACSTGLTECIGGSIQCVGSVEPATETCNGEDDDCDSMVDEGDPDGGRLCGSRVGTCTQGREVCTGGALVCTGEVGGSAEVCDGLDNDCDGTIDEGNPDGGTACGETEGECTAGMEVCTGGVLICMGGTSPSLELCNMLDDDCDGSVDEGNPEAGALCGTDVGLCRPGVQACNSGVLECIGETLPGVEACNSLDDDCDGSVDEGNPDGGAACGDTTGACSAGGLACRSGTLVCEGFTGPVAESCNGLDDDCNGSIDETFTFSNDVNNCGGCGTVCTVADGTPQCATSSCRIAGCDTGFVDLDGRYDTGCEYACSFTGAEVCNGLDDDCDGLVDEPADITLPTTFCSANGVCSMDTVRCGGVLGFVCDHVSTFEVNEVTCDGLDNDCDGAVDEPFGLLGTACSNGIGLCERTGTFVCNGAGDNVACDAAAAGTPGDELCDNIDNDCDGAVDERGVDDPGTAWRDALDTTAFDNVTVERTDGSPMLIMQYEASRPDATAGAQGSVQTLACSRPGVRPWTNVTWDEAVAACCAMNPGGVCPGAATAHWQLCDAPDWQSACEGPSDSCEWSYASSCAASSATTCNGAEVDCDPVLDGDQDCIDVTGSASFSSCGTAWAGAGTVFDLSGNVKEWTATAAATDIYEQRGGAYTTIELGRTCDFDFTVAERSFAFTNTGFRCCHH